MVYFMFLAFCSHLNVQFESLKVTLRYTIKIASFIAFVSITAYLLYDVIHTVESNDGLIKQNDELIKGLEDKKSEILSKMSNAAKTKMERSLEKAFTPFWTDEEFKFFTTKLDEANNQQIQLRHDNIEIWKWKIGTLITLNAAFLSIAKFF